MVYCNYCELIVQNESTEHEWTKKYPNGKCYPVFEENFKDYKYPVFVKKKFLSGGDFTHFVVAG